MWCCRDCSWGSSNAGKWPFCTDPAAKIGEASGMFVRYKKAYKFGQVADGLSHTVMAGETLPAHNAFNSRGLFLSHGSFYAAIAVERLGLAPEGLVRAGCACYTTRRGRLA
jgi:hypothetical protein